MAGPKTTSSTGGLYPIGLLVQGRRCLVVGSGSTARRKARELRDCGALVHAVAPDGDDELETPSPEAELSRSRRAFVPADLDDVHLVVAATDDLRVREEVARSAEARGIPCNVVDVNHLCTFFAPAVLRRGAVTVSVATDGKFPLLAVALRDRFAAMLGEALGPALELLAEGRDLARARFPDDPTERTAVLRGLLSHQALDWILEGRLERFAAHWESWKTEISNRV